MKTMLKLLYTFGSWEAYLYILLPVRDRWLSSRELGSNMLPDDLTTMLLLIAVAEGEIL